MSYYNSQRSDLGTEFLAEFERTAERILKLPNAGRMAGEDVRPKPVHRFPFYVLYRSQEDEITIIAIAHRRRRPRYWLERT